ncbi:MAG: hypothetical protein JSV63_01415 [Candidatus Aenigmatarchaeota archaeon]|nr:MAG: hypothetical protein JSV63_01415 [Candidatus Aenigmarchaeota archaeon]
MKIPKRDVVKFVVKSVLSKKSAGTQQELSGLVNAELRKVDPDYSVSGKRLREIALTISEVKIEVRVRKGGTPKRCPSCSSSLKKTWDRNLRGRKVLRDLICHKCGYRGTTGRWSPSKYGFSMKK